MSDTEAPFPEGGCSSQNSLKYMKLFFTYKNILKVLKWIFFPWLNMNPFDSVCLPQCYLLPHISYFGGDRTSLYWLIFFLFVAVLHACELLVPQPGLKPGPLAVKAWCPNHRTTREFPALIGPCLGKIPQRFLHHWVDWSLKLAMFKK